MVGIRVAVIIALCVVYTVRAQVAEMTATAAGWADDIRAVRAILDSNGRAAIDPATVTREENGRIVSLNLTSADVTRPTYVKALGQIGTLSALRELVLARNDLTALPVELAQCTRLRKIDLAYNRLDSLPAYFSELRELEQLDIRYNKIAVFPALLFNLKNLRILQFWGNALTQLPENIDNLPALKELYLKDNRLTTLPRAIMKMPALVYLDIGYNKLCNLSPDLHAWMIKRDGQYKAGQRCW